MARKQSDRSRIHFIDGTYSGTGEPETPPAWGQAVGAEFQVEKCTGSMRVYDFEAGMTELMQHSATAGYASVTREELTERLESALCLYGWEAVNIVRVVISIFRDHWIVRLEPHRGALPVPAKDCWSILI